MCSSDELPPRPPAATPPILRVGLTGNIAAGKSTVSAWLSELGCFVVNADELGHAGLEPGLPTHEEIVLEFGSSVLTDTGSIDRHRLGHIVFSDIAARQRLEEILHPYIRRREEELITRWMEGVDGGIAVTEAALLFETHSTARYHRIVAVVAPDGERSKRLQALGLSAEEAARRMGSQMNQREKSELADFVVDNGGDLGVTRHQVTNLREALGDDLEALRYGRALPPVRPI